MYASLEDRNADVRKGAGEAVLPFMIHLGYDVMARHAGKLKVGAPSRVLNLFYLVIGMLKLRYIRYL